MIVAGFGCRSGAEAASFRAALALQRPASIGAFATLSHKAALLAPLADALGLPLILVEPASIEGIATLTRSPASLAAYRTGSVAEAVALVAAGSGARLLSCRSVSPDGQATCALAQGISA
ncbi:MAG TPA: cobalamin biosynthesis protein [Sphingobium sp.]|nr:cobalamin biosynthesis protein [Sphingobium sp.]